MTTRPDGSFQAIATPEIVRDCYGHYRRTLRSDDSPRAWQPVPPAKSPAPPAGDPERALALMAEFRERYAEILTPDPFGEPASKADLDEIERLVGAPLPADLRALYEVSDGAETFGLPFAGVIWDELFGVAGEYRTAGEARGQLLDWDGIVYEPHPPDTVHPVPWHPRWVPFASDWCGNQYAVDLNPASAGHFGQVIEIGRDHDDGPALVAPSVTHLLEESVRCLREGRYEIEDGELHLLPEQDEPPSEDPERVEWVAALPGEWPKALRQAVHGRGHSRTSHERVSALRFPARSIGRDLSPLAALPFLQELRLWHLQAGTDLAPLAALRRLRALQVSLAEEAAEGPALSVLHDLPMEVLRLSGWPADLTPLAGHPTLRSLTLKGQPGSVDLAVLETMQALRHVDLTGVAVADLGDGSCLVRLTELRKLELTAPQWAAVAPVARRLPKLAEAVLVADPPWTTPMARAVRWAAIFDEQVTDFGEPFHRGHRGDWFGDQLVIYSGRLDSEN
ncbi:MAG TPA: SMI1/KNR4 family protein [Micromonospora sp.]